MLSWRLWQSLTKPAYKNPIFRRVYKPYDRQHQARITIHKAIPRLILLLLVLAALRNPEHLLLLLQVPSMVILLIILIPVFLPIIILFAGAYLIYQITGNIHKEKQQNTYELLCASPEGSLQANWLLASGILYRGNWFQWMTTGVRLTFRIGLIVLAIITCFTFYSIASHPDTSHFEAFRLVIIFALFVGLYYASMVQKFVLSVLVGLYTTCLDLSSQDSMIVGLTTHFILQFVPYLLATLLFILGYVLLPQENPALLILIDCVMLGSILISREIIIHVLWGRLTHRLNSQSDTSVLIPQRPSIYSEVFQF